MILVGPSFMGPRALFPLENPGIVSIPVGFLARWPAPCSVASRSLEESYDELLVRANTGLGAEKAAAH